jgi:hypothetical protein
MPGEFLVAPAFIERGLVQAKTPPLPIFVGSGGANCSRPQGLRTSAGRGSASSLVNRALVTKRH